MSNPLSSPDIMNINPSKYVLDSFRIAIAKLVSASLPPLTLEQAYEGVDYGKKGVDFTVALPRFRLSGKVDELAKKVLDQFSQDEYISSVTHDKTFLHFTLNTSNLISRVLRQVHDLSRPPSGISTYGHNDSGTGKKVIIEYSSPNIAKSFHVGHIRGTILGAFLANLYKACGWDVISMNYLGDWGTQFGLIATGFEKYGSEEELQRDPIKHLFDVYVAISKEAEDDPSVQVSAAQWFKRMEDGDESALRNWREWRELSVKRYQQEYERLNIEFDVYTGESEVGREWMSRIVQKLDAMGLVEDVDGAKRANLEQWGLDKPVLWKTDGTSNYLVRDVAAAIERHEKYKFDKMLYVVATAQDIHLARLFRILQILDFPWADTLQHVGHGLVLGMKTRKGTVVFLSDIFREAGHVMHDQMRKKEEKYQAVEDPEGVSMEIGITGVKIQDMAAKRINNYDFKWERMTSFEGDTGPYLQYAHVRLASVERKNAHLTPLPPPEDIDTSSLSTIPQVREIVFLLASYPNVVKVALRTHEPSGVVTFAFRLSHAISRAWETVAIKDEENLQKAQARLWVFMCARDVLGEAMRILSIRPLHRM